MVQFFKTSQTFEILGGNLTSGTVRQSLTGECLLMSLVECQYLPFRMEYPLSGTGKARYSRVRLIFPGAGESSFSVWCRSSLQSGVFVLPADKNPESSFTDCIVSCSIHPSDKRGSTSYGVHHSTAGNVCSEGTNSTIGISDLGVLP